MNLLCTHNIKMIAVGFKNRIFDWVKTGEAKIMLSETLLTGYGCFHKKSDMSFQYEVTWLLGDGWGGVNSGWQTTFDPFVCTLYQER